MMSTLGKESLWLPDISIMKKYDYDHLEEIEVRREDQKLYKFREVKMEILLESTSTKLLVMAIYAILISLDSSEESVGMFTARVILFGTIPTTISSTTPTTDLPAVDDDIPLIPTNTPTTPPIVPTIPPIASTIQYTSLFPTSSDSYSNTSSYSSLRHSSSGYAISDSLCDSSTATSAGPSHKKCRSPTLSVPIVSPVHRALSPVRADLLPPCKRVRDFGFVTVIEDSYEPYTELDVDFNIQPIPIGRPYRTQPTSDVDCQKSVRSLPTY
nr:hypothetical protein [Tanacetum cinerariifolium]